MKQFLVAGALVCLSGPAMADYYGSLNLGGAAFPDADSSGGGITVTSDFDKGYLFSGAMGYRLSNNLRIEGELSYRKADIDNQTVSVAGLSVAVGDYATVSGSVSTTALMANLAYDFEVDGLKPYLLGGIGAAKVSINDAKINSTAIADDSDTVLAFQIGAGVNYAVSETVDIGIGYRYMRTADPSFTDAGGSSFDSEHSSHSLMAGVTFGF